MTEYLESYRRMARAIRFVPPLARNQEYHKQKNDLMPPAVVVNSGSRKIVPDTTETPALTPPIDPSEHIAALVRSAVSKPTVIPVTYAIPENIGDRIRRLAPPKPLNQVVFAPKLPQPDPNWLAEHQVASHPATDEPTQVQQSITSAITDSSVVAPVPEVQQDLPAPETQASSVLIPDAQLDEAAPTSATAEDAPPTEETPVSDEITSSLEIEAIAPETPYEEEIPSQEPTLLSYTSEDLEQTSSVAAETFITEVQPADETEIPPTDTEASVPETVPLEPHPTEENAIEVTPASSLESTDRPPVAPFTSVLEETHSQVLEVEQSTETEVLPQLETPAPVESQQVTSPSEGTETNLESLSSSSPEVTSKESSVQPTISEPEETQIKCPACDSTDLRKNGHRKDKQRYLCKDCGKQFVEPDTIAAKNQLSSSKESAPKTAETQENQSVNGVGDRTPKSTSNQGKTTKKAKGFGTRKTKK